jgi:transcription antitermination factor NusB
VRTDRHHARILAMQALCQLDVQGERALADIEAFLREAEAGWPDASANEGDRFVQERDSSVRYDGPERAGANERLLRDTRRYAQTLVELAWEKQDRFGERIQAAGPSWSVERMAMVDRNVIRVALAELTLGEVPPKVVLNEAIEIAREYASAASAGFVNGVLDALYKSMKKEEGDRPQRH